MLPEPKKFDLLPPAVYTEKPFGGFDLGYSKDSVLDHKSQKKLDKEREVKRMK